MKKRLENMDVTDKTVIVRCDYNVPISDGKIIDDNKIINSLATINYLLSKNCKIVLLSHLGKVKTESDKKNNSLEPVAKRLEELLNRKVYFMKDIMDVTLPAQIKVMLPKDIILLENTRFLDVPNNLESNCDPQISSFLASLGDVFVMDAFASAHRNHASVTGIPKYIPSCLGLNAEKEILCLEGFFKDPSRPFAVIMGGAKVEDKIELIESMLLKCDYLLLAGGLANSFLKALDFNIGASLATKDKQTIEKLKNLMLENREKLMLPLDAIVGNTYDQTYTRYKLINEITDDEIIYDIGIKTINKYKEALNESKTIFINGTMGVYEDYRYANGTKEILNVLANNPGIVVAGGGDGVSAVNTFGFADKFTFLSTGGGATLKYLTEGHLVGIDCIMEDDEVEVLDV